MKQFTKTKILPFLLAAFMALCAFFGIILTTPLTAKADETTETPDFSTWFSAPLEVDTAIGGKYIRVNNVSEVPEDIYLTLPNIQIQILKDTVYLVTPDEQMDTLPIVARYEDSYVFYVEPYSKTWPEYDNLVLSISEGDLLGLLDAGEPYPDGFLEHFEILGEPPVLGMQSKTLEVGDDLAGKWVYMPNGAGADVVLSKTLPIDQVGEVAEVDFFLGFFGNPYNSPNQAADDCPCYWDFSELGIEEFTDGSKAYYKIPETFTLSHSAECAINETEEFVAGDLVVKRIDCAEGTELMLFYEAPAVEDETTDNTEKEDKPVIDLDAIGEWFNGIGEDVSAWLSDNDIEISASGVLVVGFAIVIIIGLVRRKRK